VSLLAASGAMSETIPPSIVLIAIASVTSVSIAALFTAGILPALVLAFVLALVARYRAGSEEDASVKVRRAPMSVVAKTLLVALPALVLPFLIRSAVMEGYATATEVSTIGIAYSLVLGLLIYRGGLAWRNAVPMLVQTASLSGSILFIVGAASAMAWALAQSGFSHDLAAGMAGVPGGANGFLLISLLAFIVLGSVLEGIPAVVLFGPSSSSSRWGSACSRRRSGFATMPRALSGGSRRMPPCAASGFISVGCLSACCSSPSFRGYRRFFCECSA
jgi:TRAP-type C4-dicarboxylate transport system permease large subunit